MTNRLIYTPPTPDRRPTGVSQGRRLSAAHLNESQSDILQTLFQHLTQSLTVLSATADLVLEGTSTAPGQALRVWLHPNARQAEEAMHRLRDMRLTKSPALTELSQSLTVL